MPCSRCGQNASPSGDSGRPEAPAYEAAARGGNIPTALNAANEVAVARFLDRKIKYLDIPDIIEYAMNEVDYINNPTVEQILSTQKIVTDMIESRW